MVDQMERGVSEKSKKQIIHPGLEGNQASSGGNNRRNKVFAALRQNEKDRFRPHCLCPVCVCVQIGGSALCKNCEENIQSPDTSTTKTFLSVEIANPH